MRTSLLRKTIRLRPVGMFLFPADTDAGGGGGGGDAGDQGGAGDEGDQGGDGKITLTQKELNDRESRVRRATEHQAKATHAKSLGYDTVEAMEAALKAHRDAEDKTKTQAQRDADAAAADRQAAATERAAAEADRLSIKVQGQLQAAGAKAAQLGKLSKLVEVDPKATDADIKAAVEATKKEFPELFGGAAGGGNQDVGGGGQGGGGKPPEGNARSARVQEELARRGHIKAEGAKV